MHRDSLGWPGAKMAAVLPKTPWNTDRINTGRAPPQLRLSRARRNGPDDGHGYFVLKIKKIVQISIVSFRPEVCVGYPLYQLRRDAHPITSFTNTVLNNVAHAQIGCDPSDVDVLDLEGKYRVAGYDFEIPEAG